MPEIEESRVTALEQVHLQTVRSKKMALFNTSGTELKDLFIAWLAISYAFAIMLAWMELGKKQPTISQILGLAPISGLNIIDLIIISLVTVGISFIFHEMGHKFVAQQYGAWAEFRMSFTMLLLAIALAWQVGFLFAAPGAVQIFGPNITKEQYGKIAAAGPVMNLFLAFAFMPLLTGTGFFYDIGRLGIMINMLLAGFNMLPISVLDGRKVLAWSTVVYISLLITVIAVGIFFAITLMQA